MAKEAVFTMKLEPELRDDFMAEAAGEDRPASQILRELMRAYIAERRAARDYDAYLHAKVAASRESRLAGQGRPDEAVEAVFAARRREVTDREA